LKVQNPKKTGYGTGVMNWPTWGEGIGKNVGVCLGRAEHVEGGKARMSFREKKYIIYRIISIMSSRRARGDRRMMHEASPRVVVTI